MVTGLIRVQSKCPEGDTEPYLPPHQKEYKTSAKCMNGNIMLHWEDLKDGGRLHLFFASQAAKLTHCFSFTRKNLVKIKEGY